MRRHTHLDAGRILRNNTIVIKVRSFYTQSFPLSFLSLKIGGHSFIGVAMEEHRPEITICGLKRGFIIKKTQETQKLPKD